MTYVDGLTQVEETVVKKRQRFLVFLVREWWEVVKTTTIGHEIHVTTDHKIDTVYVNGQAYEPADHIYGKTDAV